MIRVIVALVIAISLISMTAPRYLDRLSKHPQPASSTPNEPVTPNRPAQTSTNYRTVTLNSDKRGHFAVSARIDGRAVDLVVDTGASRIVLRETSAARLGIFPRASEYVGRAQTANGVAKFAPVHLNSVEVDGITVHNVEAAVMPDEALHENLLGMTFLSRVKWSHDRGRLVLEQ